MGLRLGVGREVWVAVGFQDRDRGRVSGQRSWSGSGSGFGVEFRDCGEILGPGSGSRFGVGFRGKVTPVL